MSAQEVHINEVFDARYFEPIEHVLKQQAPSSELSNFDIITDRNNLRKVASALGNTGDYTDFEIKARLYGKTLVLKREELEAERSSGKVGLLFEEALTQKTPFESCHAVIQVDIKTEDFNCDLLLRCEVD